MLFDVCCCAVCWLLWSAGLAVQCAVLAAHNRCGCGCREQVWRTAALPFLGVSSSMHRQCVCYGRSESLVRVTVASDCHIFSYQPFQQQRDNLRDSTPTSAVHFSLPSVIQAPHAMPHRRFSLVDISQSMRSTCCLYSAVRQESDIRSFHTVAQFPQTISQGSRESVEGNELFDSSHSRHTSSMASHSALLSPRLNSPRPSFSALEHITRPIRAHGQE